MPLTAQEHQKIAVLQQAANLVTQAQSVAGNPQVLNNVINNLLPQIQIWERSDPEFAELASQMRQARSGMSPHYLANIAGQVQRMISIIRTGLPNRTDPQYGLKTEWDPIRGNVSGPMIQGDEPIRTFSPYGWRGSKRFPMGLPFPQWNVVEGWDGLAGFGGTLKGTLIGLAIGTIAGVLVEQISKSEIKEPIVAEIAAPAVASIFCITAYLYFR